MKPYLVFTSDLAVAPLQGKNPRAAKKTDFENIDKAREFAACEKDQWNIVIIYKRDDKGDLKRIEHYLYGRNYIDR